MEIGWLLDFLALVETRSFSEAAKGRNSSQSAFSRRIQSLESWLGARVVDRATQPITVTSEGLKFEKQAREIVLMAQGARDSVKLASAHNKK